MLFRKRERFERTDVPTPGPFTNIIGGAVLAVVAVAVILVITNVADRVSKETRLQDYNLSKQVGKESAMVVTDDQYQISKDTFTKILFLTVADASDMEKGTQVTQAQVLLLHEKPVQAEDGSETTQTVASLATIPLDAKIGTGGDAATLADYCAAHGPAACVVPLNAACNIKFTHVVVASEDVLEQVMAFSGSDPSKFIADSTPLLMKLRTDMTAAELVEVGTKATTVGAENFNRVDAPLVPEVAQADDGSTQQTGFQVIDRTALCTSVATLV